MTVKMNSCTLKLINRIMNIYSAGGKGHSTLSDKVIHAGYDYHLEMCVVLCIAVAGCYFTRSILRVSSK